MSASSWFKWPQMRSRRGGRTIRRGGPWARPRLEYLEDRIAPAINWTGGSGSFTDPAHWVGGAVPGPNDDAVINVVGVTVTYGSGSTAVHSLTYDDTLILSGGTLSAGTLQTQNSSSFLLQGGTLASTTVTGSTLTGTGTSSTLSAVTLQNSILDMQTNSSSVTVSGSLTLSNSAVNLGKGDGSTYGQLYFSDSSAQLLDGADSSHTGTIVLGPNGNNRITDNSSSGYLTLGSNLTVQGLNGTISANNGMDIKAAVTVDPTLFPGRTTGFITISGTNWTNDATLTGKNGGGLSLQGTNWTNNSTVTVQGGGNLTINGSSSATTHAWSNTGAISFSGGGILTLQSSGTTMTTDNSGWSNTGTITATGATTTVNLGGTFTKAALGNFSRVNGPTDDIVNLTGTLNNAGLTQTFDSNSGSWYLNGGTLNGGTLTAAAGYALISNSGTLIGVTIDGSGGNASPLDMQTNSSSVTVSGALMLSNSTIHLGSSSTYGQLYFSDSSAQLLDGIDSSHPGTIVLGPNGNNRITDNSSSGYLTLGSNLTVQGLNGTISANNGMDIKAAVTVDPTLFPGWTTGFITISGTNWKNDTTLTGKNGGGLSLQGTNWTNNSTVTVQGGGNLTINGSSSATAHAWSNTGAISFSGGGILTLQSSGTAMTTDNSGWSNTGTITATGTTTTVNLGGTFTKASLGNFSRVNGPTDDIVNLTGTLNNAGLTQTFDSNSGSWYLNGGTLNGGTLTAAAGYALISNSGTLIGVTIDGSGGNASPLDMQTNSNSVTVSGALTLSNSTIHLGNSNGSSSTYGQLYFSDSSAQLLDGADSSHPGTIVLGPSGNNLISDNASSGYLTLGSNLTVQGLNGRISANNGMDIKAAVTADPTLFAGQSTGVITLSGSNLKDDGVLTARYGGTLRASGFTNFTGGTLTGGAWQAVSGGTLDLVGADITTLAANVLLDSAGSLLLSNNGGTNTNALAGLTTIAAGGGLTVQNGFNFSSAGNLSNAGALTVGPASTLTVSGNYTQAAAAILTIDIGGHASAGQFGKFAVTQTPTLAGNLDIQLVSGFLPNSTETYQIMTFAAGSRSSDFATKQGLTFADGRFVPGYGSNNLTLTIAPLTSSGFVVYGRADDTIWQAGLDGSYDVQIATGSDPRLSPNGRYLIYHEGTNANPSRRNVFVQDLATGTTTQILQNNDYAVNYSWTADSNQIVLDYATAVDEVNRDGTNFRNLLQGADAFDDAPALNPVDGTLACHNENQGLVLANADGSGRHLISNTKPGDFWPTWSADGQWICFERGTLADYYNAYQATGLNLFKIHPDGTGLTQLTFVTNLTTQGFGTTGAFTADGSDVVAEGTTASGSGLYLIAADGSGTMTRVSTSSGAAINFVGTVSGVANQALITSADHATFTIGSTGSFQVTVAGTPTPAVSVSGTLPGTVTFNPNTDVLSGDPGTAPGTYPLVFTAHNGVGSDGTQNFTLTVNNAPAPGALIFTTAAQTLILGQPSALMTVLLEDGSGNVIQAGPSGVALTLSSTSSHGTFLDTSGMPLANSSITVGPGSSTASFEYADTATGTPKLTAAASSFSASQQETVVPTSIPPSITSGGATTFTVGSNGSFPVTSTGTPTPTLSEVGALPTGVSFTTNLDGTATLSGMPTAGTGGTYTFTIAATNGVGTNAKQSFTLTVDEAPTITTVDNTAFAVGVNGTFTLHATGYPTPSLSIPANSLPADLAFTPNPDGTATLNGTPAAGTGGTYNFTVTADNGIGSAATQSFTLAVNLASHFGITAPASVTSGTPFTITVAALDYRNNPVNSYTGTVHLTASDGQAVLPADQLINASWPFNVTLTSLGSQSITVTDTANNALAGTTGLTIAVQPAVDTWINPAGGDWDTASNWSTGQVPGPLNAAVINMPGITVTHASEFTDSVYSLTSAATDLVFSVGSLSVAAASTIHHLTMTNGALSGSGLVTINGLAWSGGTMTGGGITDIPAGGQLTISGATDMLDTRTLRNEGAATWTGPGMLQVTNSLIDNRPGATFTITGGPTITSYGNAPAQFTNEGTVNVAAGSGAMAMGIPFTNNGKLHVQSGTLSLSPTASSAGSIVLDAKSGLTLFGTSYLVQGAMTAAAGATITNASTLNVAGAWTFNAPVTAAFINNGTLNKTGTDSLTIPAAFMNFGTVEVQAGVLSLAGGGGATGSFLVDAKNTLNFASPTPGAYLLKAGSSVSGDGSVTFNQGTTNLGGNYNMTGGTEVAGGVANFTSPVTSVGALIVAHGTANFSTGSAITIPSLTIEEATLTGSDRVTVSGSMSWLSGTMSGTGATVIWAGAQLALTDGTLDTRSLINQGSVTAAMGSILTLAHGASVNNAGFAATWNDQGGNAVTGSGTFNNNNGVYLNSGSGTTSYTVPFNNSGSVEVQAGTLSVGGGGQSSVGAINLGGVFKVDAGALLTFPGGTYVFSTGTQVVGTGFADVTGATAIIAATVNAAKFELDAGAIAGPGDLDVSDTFTWTGGNLQGTGMVRLGANALLNATAPPRPVFTGQRAIVPVQDIIVSPPVGSGAGTVKLATYPEHAPAGIMPTFLYLCTFSDGARPAPASAYTPTITWGDGTPSSLGRIAPRGDGSFDVTSPAHPYTEEGTFNVHVQIAETDGESAGSTFTEQVTVTDAALGGVARSATLPLPSSQPGGGFTFSTNTVVATFWDPGNDGTTADYSATVRWEGGNPTAAHITAAGNGFFNVTAGTTYPLQPLPFSVTINDHGGASATFAGTLFPAVIVLPLGQQLRLLQAHATDSTVAEGASGNTVLASFTSPLGGGTGAYPAIIYWPNTNTTTNAIVQQASSSSPYQVVTQQSFNNVGNAPFQVTINHAGNVVAMANGIVSVTEVPMTATGYNFTAVAGNTVLVKLASYSDTSYRVGQAFGYNTVIDWGDGTPLGGNGYTTGSADIFGSHVYAQPGSYKVRVIVLAGDGGTVEADGTATVIPTTVTATGQTASGYWDVSGTAVVATFRDQQASTSVGAYTATIDWQAAPGSFGTDTSAGTIIANGDGSFSVVGTHTYHNYETFPVYVTISKATGALLATAVATANVGVGVHALNLVEGSGEPSQAITAFPNLVPPGADATQYRATINWGDGPAVYAATIDGTQDPLGAWIVKAPAHNFVEAGSYAITITVTDPLGKVVQTAQDTATITDAALSPLGGVTTSPQAGYPANIVVASFTDQTAFARPSDFSATINWGDGQTALATFIPAAYSAQGQTRFSVFGNHTYAASGTYTVSGVIYDAGGAALPFSSSLQATLPPLQTHGNDLLANAGGAVSGTVATFVVAGNPNTKPSDFSSTTINWGDGTTTGVPNLTVSAVGSLGHFNVTAAHTYAAPGVYNVTVNIVNSAGPSATASALAIFGTAPAVGVGSLGTFLTANLGALQTDLNTGAFKNPVPLIGSQLATSPVGQVIAALQGALTGAFAQIDPSLGNGLQAALFEALGPANLNVLQPADGSARAVGIGDVVASIDGSGNLNYEVHLYLQRTLNQGRVNFDAVLPGLLRFNDTAHSVNVQAGYFLDLKFGTSTGSSPTPFISPTNLVLTASATAVGMDIPGTLFFVKLDARDTGSFFLGTYNLSFSRPASSTSLVLSGPATLAGQALESLHLDASWVPVPGGLNWGPTNTLAGAIGSALNSIYPPHLLADLNVNWNFNNADTSKMPLGDKPTVQFNNVALDLGSFFGSWAGPLVQGVQAFTQPLEGLAQMLLAPVPVLDQITEFFGAGKFDFATMLGLFAQLVSIPVTGTVPNKDNPTAADVLNFFAKAIDTINNLKVPAASGVLPLGNFTVTDPRPTTPDQKAFNTSTLLTFKPKDAQTAAQNNANPKVSDYFKLAASIKFDFPIIDNPVNAFLILMGDTKIDLFDFTVKLGFTVTAPPIKIPIPLPPPLPTGILNFLLTFATTFNVNFTFGYDENGLKTGKASDGFFVQNLSLGFSETTTLGADLNGANVVDLIIGVNVTIGATWKILDDQTNSTKLRWSALHTLTAMPTETASGSPFAELDIWGHCLLKIKFGTISWVAGKLQIAGITTGCN